MKRSKAYREAVDQFDPNAVYSPAEAIKLAKNAHPKARFDQSVEVAMRLGVDPRKADQMVRGTVNLPHGTGKTAKVLVFGFGISPRGPRTRPRRPTLPIMSGVATTASKSSHPPLILSIRSSPPT